MKSLRRLVVCPNGPGLGHPLFEEARYHLERTAAAAELPPHRGFVQHGGQWNRYSAPPLPLLPSAPFPSTTVRRPYTAPHPHPPQRTNTANQPPGRHLRQVQGPPGPTT